MTPVPITDMGRFRVNQSGIISASPQKEFTNGDHIWHGLEGQINPQTVAFLVPVPTIWITLGKLVFEPEMVRNMPLAMGCWQVIDTVLSLNGVFLSLNRVMRPPRRAA